ncbi:MAG: MerR family transcriptional regulator, partial [Chloroflexota bacterium]
MNDQRPEANLTISQFGRLCQLSRKALRLYDERGLLPPARIDPESGYRYYDQDQVTVARRI